MIVAVVPCITTSLCLFLGCVLLIRSSFGWLCGRLGRWVACSLQLFCHWRICWPPCEPDTEGWHSQRERPGRTSNTAFEGLDFL